jgi:DHA2 family multidrug resistance protein
METEAPSKAAEQSATHAVGARKWMIAIAVMLGTALEVLDISIINVSLPHMQGSFSAGVDQISWVLTSYLVANGIMIPMTGWISSRFGRKRYFLTSVAVFVTASALCGIAGSLDQMVLFRFIQGAAGAAMVPSSQAILMETFPPSEQQLAMATWGLGLMVAPIMGPTLGGWITDNLNWRWNFYINLPIGIAALLMVSAFVEDPPYLRQRRARGGRVDYPGITLLAVGLGAMQIVLDRGQRAGWFAAHWVVLTTALSGACLILLPIHELRAKEPILDMRILAIPVFALAVLVTIGRSFVLYGTGLLNPIFLQEFMGYSAWKAGLVLAPRGLGTMFSMILVGQVSRRKVDTRPLLGLGFVLMAYSLWMMSQWNLQVSFWAVVWPGLLLGIGMGLTFPIISAVSLACVNRSRMGDAASLYNMMRNTGAAVGISYLTNMLVSHEQIHQSRLVNNVTVFRAWQLSRMGPHMPGAPSFHYLPEVISGQKQGLALLYHSVRAQAGMLAFDDIYRMLVFMCVLMIPSFYYFKASREGGSPAGH